MSSMYCLNKECRCQLAASGRSSNNPKYCPDCGDLVYAFRPDSDLPDDWYEVSDGEEPVEGNYVRGGQCEGCALSEYRVERVGRRSWVAACRGQFVDLERRPGCGALHPVRMKMRHLVVLKGE